MDSYLLPRIDNFLTLLSGGTSFSKLDLVHAYMLFQLEAESEKLTTINTEKRLYCYGIAAAPAIFQRLPNVILL